LDNAWKAIAFSYACFIAVKAMLLNKQTDLLLNVCLPLITGSLFYILPFSIPVLLKNHLPDGLWAYAFISCLVIIQDRTISPAWVAAAFLVAGGFEGLQYCGAVAGAGDPWDVAVYFLFFTASLLLNSFFKKYHQTKTAL
jgi:hypothetical protein